MKELPVFIAVLVFGFLALCFLVLGLGNLFYQAWAYFSVGVWPSFSVIDAVATVYASDWLANPQSFQTMHAVLDAIPFPLAAIGIGILSFSGFSWLS